MLYTDPIYGEFNLAEPVFDDLIESPEMQRLRGVNQHGYFAPVFPKSKKGNRFDHSVGVALLLRKFGAPLPEQIAGLLHDVSHSAFSHAIDYVMKTGSQATHDYQDNFHADYLRASGLPALLQRHGFVLDQLLDDHRFPLKEQPLPELCADRIDYILRDGIIYDELTLDAAQNLVAHLAVEDGRWYIDDAGTAKTLVKHFQKMNSLYYSGLETAIMFQTLADCLRHALQKKYLEPADLYTTDAEVFKKITAHLADDEHLRFLWDRLQRKIPCVNSPNKTGTRVLCKSRAINPWVNVGGNLRRYSELDPTWAAALPQEMQPREYFLEFAK